MISILETISDNYDDLRIDWRKVKKAAVTIFKSICKYSDAGDVLYVDPDREIRILVEPQNGVINELINELKIRRRYWYTDSVTRMLEKIISNDSSDEAEVLREYIDKLESFLNRDEILKLVKPSRSLPREKVKECIENETWEVVSDIVYDYDLFTMLTLYGDDRYKELRPKLAESIAKTFASIRCKDRKLYDRALLFWILKIMTIDRTLRGGIKKEIKSMQNLGDKEFFNKIFNEIKDRYVTITDNVAYIDIGEEASAVRSRAMCVTPEIMTNMRSTSFMTLNLLEIYSESMIDESMIDEDMKNNIRELVRKTVNWINVNFNTYVKNPYFSALFCRVFHEYCKNFGSHCRNNEIVKVLAKKFKALSAIKECPVTKIKEDILSYAIELSKKCEPEDDRIHPKVAALLIREGEDGEIKVIAEAFRNETGDGEHAESILLSKMGRHKGPYTLITTLEPCTTRRHRNFKSCTDLILHYKNRIWRIIVGHPDPNPEIEGEGILKLKDAGVMVEVFPPSLMEAIEKLNEEFIKQYSDP